MGEAMANFQLRASIAAFATGLALLAGCAPVEREAAPAVPEHWPVAAISSDRFESHPAFDPLTGDLYFVRSSPQFQGWRILRAPCSEGGWGTPEPAPFSGPGVEADPVFAENGRRIWFISSRPDPPAKTAGDLDIWTAERGRGGAWGAPARLPAPVNSPGAEWFPRPDRAGNLYFGSDRPGGHGATDIYIARRAGNGGWTVENVGGEVSTAGNEYEFEPALGGGFAVQMADGLLFRIESDGAGWGRRTPLLADAEGFHVGPSLSPSGRTLLFARRHPSLSGELYRLALGDSETWPPACPRR